MSGIDEDFRAGVVWSVVIVAVATYAGLPLWALLVGMLAGATIIPATVNWVTTT